MHHQHIHLHQTVLFLIFLTTLWLGSIAYNLEKFAAMKSRWGRAREDEDELDRPVVDEPRIALPKYLTGVVSDVVEEESADQPFSADTEKTETTMDTNTVENAGDDDDDDDDPRAKTEEEKETHAIPVAEVPVNENVDETVTNNNKKKKKSKQAIREPPPSENEHPLRRESQTLTSTRRLPKWKPGKPFGTRNAYRTAHIRARELSGGEDFFPFKEELVAASVRGKRRIEMEVEFFRFRDAFGFIDSGWDDATVERALQSLVDIWAQANIWIRIRRSEALAFVDLSREKSLAYWYYVDYPKDPSSKYKLRAKRRAAMDKIFGKPLLEVLSSLNEERQALFDWIVGWQEERTPWENENVAGIFPVFYYYYMNGGGERGAIRFRTGDCKTARPLPYGMKNAVLCQAFDPREAYDDGRRVVRAWERGNFTAAMGIRLVSHETGHTLGLGHPRIPPGEMVSSSSNKCKRYENWESGDLMAQVRSMTVGSLKCTGVGYPALAVKATYLNDEMIVRARRHAALDVRESLTPAGWKRVGNTTEVLPHTTSLPKACIASGVLHARALVFAAHPSTANGLLGRIRWKSSRHFRGGEYVKIVVGRLVREAEGRSSLEVTGAALVKPHRWGANRHQEFDLSKEGLAIRRGDVIGMVLVGGGEVTREEEEDREEEEESEEQEDEEDDSGEDRKATTNEETTAEGDAYGNTLLGKRLKDSEDEEERKRRIHLANRLAKYDALVPGFQLYRDPHALTGEILWSTKETMRRHPRTYEVATRVDPTFRRKVRYDDREIKGGLAVVHDEETDLGTLLAFEPGGGTPEEAGKRNAVELRFVNECPGVIFNYDVGDGEGGEEEEEISSSSEN